MEKDPRELPELGQSVPEREIVVTRTIDGPPHVVFEAFTEVRHLSQWWGPKGFSTTTHSFEFRPGGLWEFTMHGPDRTDYPNVIEWIEIEAPKRMVFRHGATVDDPESFISTVTLVLKGIGTEVTLRTIFSTASQREKVVWEYRAIEGAEQTLGRLAEHVASWATATD
ncbi:MAG TPA: SRPBCC family protein [Acidimicrobiia bacterium]|nr:SRPBCC family protein [Acidimicrobiia bacterium]